MYKSQRLGYNIIKGSEYGKYYTTSSPHGKSIIDLHTKEKWVRTLLHNTPFLP